MFMVTLTKEGLIYSKALISLVRPYFRSKNKNLTIRKYTTKMTDATRTKTTSISVKCYNSGEISIFYDILPIFVHVIRF